MLADRFGALAGSSGASTPQPSSRPYSPTPPRRTISTLSPYITSQRPGHTPRASTTSLISSDSNTSLLASSRRVNGSSLRQSTTADDGSEALEVLAGLLGTDDKLPKSPRPLASNSITEEDLELDFDLGGRSLRELAESEEPPEATEAPSSQTAKEYEKEKTTYEELHRSINACDSVLGAVETNLASFRNDLAAVSADIETLQSRSTSLNVRLENRKAVEKALGPVVEELSVSPVIVSKIAEGPIDESWAKALAEVDKRAVVYKNNTSGPRRSKAWADLGPLLEKLIQKAVERIRDFLVAQIKALRSPNINAQIIQQKNFLRFKDLYGFLHKHHATLADEICLAYMNTMRWYYANQFARYRRALEKIKLHVIDKSDVLAHEDSSTRKTTATSMLSAATGGGSRGGQHGGPPHDAFNLGRRVDLLRTPTRAALSSYLAEEDQGTHYLEVPFHNLNLALVDNAAAEYSFLAGFFSPPLSLAIVGRHFTYIFEPTFALAQAMTKSLTAETYDAVGLLLCVRLNQRAAFELQRRKVPALDGYVNATNMLLWPRLQVVMDQHCESVRHAAAALPAKAPMGRPAAGGASALSAAPHVVTQRFGQLLFSVLALSTDAGDDEPVATSLRRLRAEVEAFLVRLAIGFGADRRRRDRFLYNNYSLVLTIIGDVEGKLAEEQQAHFEQLKAAVQEDA